MKLSAYSTTHMICDSNSLTLCADGLCEPNPGGYACWAWVALQGGRVVAHDAGCLGHGAGMSNNVAEYRAVLHALAWLQRQHFRGVVVHTDSLLVVRQIAGDWQVNADHLQPLCAQAQAFCAATGACVRWIPRVQNARADALTRQAYAKARRGRP